MSANVLSERYGIEHPFLKQGLKKWTRKIRKLAVPIDANVVVAGRVKQLQSVLVKSYKKGPENPRGWEDFGDLVALKVIFPTKEGADKFTDVLEGKGNRQKFLINLDKRVSGPDELRYASNQFDLCHPRVCDSREQGIKVEVQVRTVASDAWYMVDHRVRYKGSVELPDDLQRKVLRLIVLAELFDSEVESLIHQVKQLEGNELTPVFNQMANTFNSMMQAYGPAARPKGLFETLLSVYPGKTPDDIEARLKLLVDSHGPSLLRVIKDHSTASENYVEAYDWLYREPETLLIADLARNHPSRLRQLVGTTDFDALLGPMAVALNGK